MKEKILAALKQPKTNKEVREALGMSTETYDSKLDRTLQKLRKSGEIQVIGGKWALATFEICDQCKGKGWKAK